MKQRITFCILAVSLLLTASCALPRLDIFTAGYGSLRLVFGVPGTKAMVPDDWTEPAYFELSGTGPKEEAFSGSTAEESIVLEQLIFGTWNISVAAYDSNDLLIGEGTEDVEILSEETTAITVQISPVIGIGRLMVDLAWNPDLLLNPSINAELVSGTGDMRPVDFSISGDGTALSEMADVASGYYTLNIHLLDGETVVAGLSDVAKVMTGEVTTGSFTFEDINKPGQAMEIQADHFTLAWDPPDETPVTTYRIYYRTRGTFEWIFLDEVTATPSPECIVASTTLEYGTYEFAVSSLYGGQESSLHGSMDDTALPATGWYVVWSAPI